MQCRRIDYCIDQLLDDADYTSEWFDEELLRLASMRYHRPSWRHLLQVMHRVDTIRKKAQDLDDKLKRVEQRNKSAIKMYLKVKRKHDR